MFFCCLCMQSHATALPCPQGTYKEALSNSVPCSPCGEGSTTHSIRSTAAADCMVAMPGYQLQVGIQTAHKRMLMVSTQDPGALHAEPCPAGSYSEGYTTESCRRCPLNLHTPSTGSTSTGDCSAPPGVGFYCPAGYPAGSGPVSTGMLQDNGGSCVLTCPPGSYKAGWGRSACVSCGSNFSSVAGATSAQQCFVPPGWGSAPARGTGNVLVARKCLHGMYGMPQPQFGTTRRYPCQVCHMTCNRSKTN
jgi:hypothetical protein